MRTAGKGSLGAAGASHTPEIESARLLYEDWRRGPESADGWEIQRSRGCADDRATAMEGR